MELMGMTFSGNRPVNEDCIFYRTEGDRTVAVVADGLGGCDDGDTASRKVVDIFQEKMPVGKEEILESIQMANKELFNAENHVRGMKSTVVALGVQNGQVCYGHVGDSRLYYFCDNQLIFQSLDHSVTQLAVLSGEIKEEEMRFHEDRNKLLRAIGAGEDVKPVIMEFGELEKGRHIFLMCTDGFWEYVTEEEMLHCIRKGTAERICERLGKRWKKKTHRKDNVDNSSFLVVCLP